MRRQRPRCVASCNKATGFRNSPFSAETHSQSKPRMLTSLQWLEEYSHEVIWFFLDRFYAFDSNTYDLSIGIQVWHPMMSLMISFCEICSVSLLVNGKFFVSKPIFDIFYKSCLVAWVRFVLKNLIKDLRKCKDKRFGQKALKNKIFFDGSQNFCIMLTTLIEWSVCLSIYCVSHFKCRWIKAWSHDE